MSLVIPNTLGNKSGQAQLGLLDENFTYIVNALNPLMPVNNKTTLGTVSAGNPTINPTSLSLGGDYSSVAGQNLKLKLSDTGTLSSDFGIGISAWQQDYVVPLSASHVFYVNAAERLRISETSITLSTSCYSSGYLNAQGNIPNTGNIATSVGGLGSIMVQGPNASTAAYMCFHKPGNYAAYFGIDTDNYFAIGGWSAGAGLANFKANIVTARSTAKAWAYLVNGIIVASHNISAVSKPGTGRYLFTMTTAMADTNYAVGLTASGNVSVQHCNGYIDSPIGSAGTYVHSTTQFQIGFWNSANSGNIADQTYLSVIVYGN